jgi:DNA-binding transcriptional LysR family regulator
MMVMLDWDDLRYFLAISRTGTLARAGALLGINATTVGRRLSALEERVGARLFDRTPEGYLLSAAGHGLLQHAERMEAEALAVEREVVGADARLQGVVRVSATEMLATRFIAPQLPRFIERHPDIVIDLNCTNKSVILARREADVALRLARPREDNVVTRRLTQIDLALYASSAYVARRTMPEDPDRSLSGHDVILFAESRAFALENDWISSRLGRAHVVLRSDSVSSIFSAVVAGVGMALLPRAVADLDIGLRRIPTTTVPEPRIVWQTVHADLQKSARVRAVLDFLGEILNVPERTG